MTCVARALFNNVAEKSDELDVNKNDRVTVLEVDPDGLEGWWRCMKNGQNGLLPANRLEVIAGVPPPAQWDNRKTTHADVTDYDHPRPQGGAADREAYDQPRRLLERPRICSDLDYDQPRLRSHEPDITHMRLHAQDYDHPRSTAASDISPPPSQNSGSDTCSDYDTPRRNTPQTTSSSAAAATPLGSCSSLPPGGVTGRRPGSTSGLSVQSDSALDSYDHLPPARTVIGMSTDSLLRPHAATKPADRDSGKQSMLSDYDEPSPFDAAPSVTSPRSMTSSVRDSAISLKSTNSSIYDVPVKLLSERMASAASLAAMSDKRTPSTSSLPPSDNRKCASLSDISVSASGSNVQQQTDALKHSWLTLRTTLNESLLKPSSRSPRHSNVLPQLTAFKMAVLNNRKCDSIAQQLTLLVGYMEACINTLSLTESRDDLTLSQLEQHISSIHSLLVNNNVTVEAEKVKTETLDSHDGQLLQYYYQQICTNQAILDEATHSFFCNMEEKQPPKLIGQTNCLCDALKHAVSCTKQAALQYPNPATLQDMVDRISGVSAAVASLQNCIVRYVDGDCAVLQ